MGWNWFFVAFDETNCELNCHSKNYYFFFHFAIVWLNSFQCIFGLNRIYFSLSFFYHLLSVSLCGNGVWFCFDLLRDFSRRCWLAAAAIATTTDFFLYNFCSFFSLLRLKISLLFWYYIVLPFSEALDELIRLGKFPCIKHLIHETAVHWSTHTLVCFGSRFSSTHSHWLSRSHTRTRSDERKITFDTKCAAACLRACLCCFFSVSHIRKQTLIHTHAHITQSAHT